MLRGQTLVDHVASLAAHGPSRLAQPAPGQGLPDPAAVVILRAARFRGGHGAARTHSSGEVMNPVHWLIDTVIELYIWVVIASVIVSWLVAFNVINTRNSFVLQIQEFLFRATEPALRPIRQFMPNLGGIDISPVILILLLIFIRRLLFQMFM
ncbi:MAG: YggT family protein [Geminicoccaceae bacterium]|nr:YggT family protein [Geminicoccaceae bacterium]